MRTLLWAALTFSSLATWAQAPFITYHADLMRVLGSDQVQVTAEVHWEALPDDLEDAPIEWQFPKTIPGTYATEDYGKYIKDLEAFKVDGSRIKVRKKGKNTYQLSALPVRITYRVNDTYDARVRKNHIFEPAGTNIAERENFLLNNAGFFGYFPGYEQEPVNVQLHYPGNMLGVSALPSQVEQGPAMYLGDNRIQSFKARDYHHLMDCPIMVTVPDTTSFYVANCKVTLSVYSESGRPLSAAIYDEVKVSMEAIASFLGGELPVDNYAFLFYIKDYTEFQSLIEGDIQVGKAIKLLRQIIGQGFGALEHGNSSTYFLPDFGNDLVLDQIKDVCIHEFLHILTPLGLHSECIGQFNYADPVMSQHLWLYEGVTEYFAGLSQVQGGVMTEEAYIQSLLEGKIRSASRYPTEKMAFTEMSTNVLEKPWKKQYGQVYQRGAVMAALLDLEIMHLTQGEKTLLDVITTLNARYGATQSFNEATFFEVFVAEVHPDLMDFFNRYVRGTEALPLKRNLAYAGFDYVHNESRSLPINPTKSKNLKLSFLPLGAVKEVKKVKGPLPFAVEKGDLVSFDAAQLSSLAGPIPAELPVEIRVQHDGQWTSTSVVPEREDVVLKHQIFELDQPSGMQQGLRSLWLSGDIGKY
jgi:predicted metalloprotease with PDZ domain